MDARTVISKCILLPASVAYGIGTYVRNKLFDFHILKQYSFDVPVIVVGNLSAGGTGKTPMVEYIIEHLRHTYHIGMVSRGYKRHTKGFVMASSKSTPRDIGDEAYQVFNKFEGDVPVAVCEDRVKGIQKLLSIDPDINLIILDDAFQHRYVKPTVAVVITEHARPVFEDRMLPYGHLRESVHGLNRAQIVVVSKCPDSMKQIDYRIYSKNLNLYPSPTQELFFSKLNYMPLKPVFPKAVQQTPFLDWLADTDSLLAVAGIGNPRPFIRYLKGFRPKVKVNIYPDHHKFTRRDLEHIRKRYESMRGNNRIIVTTEKDAVRLANNPYFPHELKAVTFYLPITVDFIPEGNPASFIEEIKKRLR